MTDKEMDQKNIEEFSRVQRYMELDGEDSGAYSEMYRRYRELKVILANAGVNLAELDYIKA